MALTSPGCRALHGPFEIGDGIARVEPAQLAALGSGAVLRKDAGLFGKVHAVDDPLAHGFQAMPGFSLGGDFIEVDQNELLEELNVNGRSLRYQQIEGSFSQPNAGVNAKMLGWASRQAANLGGDLLELYCGNGNFTVALAPAFYCVLATEMSKSSVRATTTWRQMASPT